MIEMLRFNKGIGVQRDLAFSGGLETAHVSSERRKADVSQAKEVLEALCKRHEATYLISYPSADKVRVSIETADGDRVSGNGKTVEEAIVALKKKLEG